MSNKTNTNAAVPMPAAMAGLIGDFDEARGVISGLGRKMEHAGAFCDSVMGDDLPSMTEDRHSRITSDLCRSRILQECFESMTNPPFGAPPADTLHTLAYLHVSKFCQAQVDHELSLVRTRLHHALSDMDLDSELEKLFDALDRSESAVLQAQASWSDLVQVGVSNRVESKIQQQQLVSELRNFIDAKVSKFRERENAKIGMASLRARYQEHLKMNDGEVSLMDMTWLQNHNSRTSSLKAHLDQVSQELGIVDDEKKKENRSFSVPKGFENGKGEALIAKVDEYVDGNNSYPTISKYIYTIGHVLDSKRGVFWEPPRKSRDGSQVRYADIPSELREAYEKESRALWIVLAANVSTDLMRRIIDVFSVGNEPYHRETKVDPFDGVRAYWAILCLTRPTSEAHKIMIEKWLNSSYKLFERTDITYQEAVDITRPYRREAKQLAMGIKWWSTGRKWVQTLSDKANFAVDIRNFLSGGSDPDDAIDHLDRLASAIVTTGKGEMGNDDTTDSWIRRGNAQSMAAEFTVADSDFPWSDFSGRVPPQSEGMFSFGEEEISEHALEVMADTIAQDHTVQEAFAVSMKGGGKSKGFLPKAHVRNLLHTAFVNRGTKGGKGGKGGGKGKGKHSKGGRGYGGFSNPPYSHQPKGGFSNHHHHQQSKGGVRKCGAHGCQSDAFRHYPFCPPCYKLGISQGYVLGKDGKNIPITTNLQGYGYYIDTQSAYTPPPQVYPPSGVYQHQGSPVYNANPLFGDTTPATPLSIASPMSSAAAAPSPEELLQQWHNSQAQAHMAMSQQGSVTESQKRGQQQMALAITGSPAKSQRLDAASAGTDSTRAQFLNLLQQQGRQMTGHAPR